MKVEIWTKVYYLSMIDESNHTCENFRLSSSHIDQRVRILVVRQHGSERVNRDVQNSGKNRKSSQGEEISENLKKSLPQDKISLCASILCLSPLTCNCICLICQMYLSDLSNVLVWVVNYIGLMCQIDLSRLSNLFVWFVDCFCLICQMYLFYLWIVFVWPNCPNCQIYLSES